MLKRIVYTGVKPNQSFKIKQRIWLTNAGALLAMFASSVYMINNMFWGKSWLSPVINFITVCLFGTVIYFNKRQLHRYSNTIYLILTLLVCYLNVILYGSQLLLHLIVIPWLILAVFLLDKKWTLVLAICVGVFSFLFFENYSYFWDEFLDITSISSLITISLSLSAFITVALFYKATHNNYEKIIQEKNETLEKQTDEIIQQNSELIEQKEEIKSQNHSLSEANDEITSSIMYSKRIQSALLPDISRFGEFFEDYFIYYKPKDIISGDFYWSAVLPDKLLLAAADCTGHGVPGALMTAICHSLLYNAVFEAQLTKPADILTYTDENLTKTLNQNSASDCFIRDGMDISLCLVDKGSKKIYFSGAKRPLYVFRNQEIIEYKANRRSIGGGMFEDEHFSQVVIDYKPNDMFYMFSDGIIDQFGGPKNKKFLVKKLKNHLTELSHLPGEQQKKELGNIIRKWKRNNDQTDDMLLIGFKM